MSQAPAITRKLTTILAADAANYSRRMAEDEVATVQALRRSRAVFERGITQRGGRIANTAGDGLIAEFPSVVEAVTAAVVIQKQLVQGEDLLPFRIGLHLGDVIVEGEDLLGDGVNLAARLQEVAPEGGILASAQVVDHARGRLQAEFRPLGPTDLKNLGDVDVFGVIAEGIIPPDDLEAVLPQLPPAARHVRPQEPAPAKRTRDNSPEAKFRRQAKTAGYVSLGLFIADLTNGPGPGWPAAVIVAMGTGLIWKWRELQKNDQ